MTNSQIFIMFLCTLILGNVISDILDFAKWFIIERGKEKLDK